MNAFIWGHILGLAVGFGAGWWSAAALKMVGERQARPDDPVDAAVRGD